MTRKSLRLLSCVRVSDVRGREGSGLHLPRRAAREDARIRNGHGTQDRRRSGGVRLVRRRYEPPRLQQPPRADRGRRGGWNDRRKAQSVRPLERRRLAGARTDQDRTQPTGSGNGSASSGSSARTRAVSRGIHASRHVRRVVLSDRRLSDGQPRPDRRQPEVRLAAVPESSGCSRTGLPRRGSQRRPQAAREFASLERAPAPAQIARTRTARATSVDRFHVDVL